MRKPFRRIGLFTVLLTLPLTFAPGFTQATSAPFPHVIPVPTDFWPEGIAVGNGSTFYVGSLRDGDIYRGDLRTGKGSLLVDTSGRFSVGMRVDEDRGYLVVAGGPSGVWVYDADTGADVAHISVNAFLNDVAVTNSAYYFTDSFGPHLVKIPVHANGAFGAAETITVTGPAGQSVPNTFGLNGIDAVGDGSRLIVNHTFLGLIALVDPATGVSTEVDIDGLIPPTLDGLQLEGRTLWVVENFANTLAKVQLSGDLSSGTLVAEIRDPAFQVPTTVARFGSRMALINSKFDLGFPPLVGGPGAPPGTTYEVVVVPAN